MINKYVVIRNLAVLFIVCNLLFWIFPFPPVFWRLSLVALSVITLWDNRRLLPCEKAVLFFAVFNLLHFFVSLLWQTPNSANIGNVICGCLSLTLFTTLSERGVMTERALVFIGILLIIASIGCYNYYDNYLISRLKRGDVTTNSYSEFFLMLLPILFFIKKTIIKWSFLVVVIFFLIMGAKRGNIIAAFIPFVFLVRQEWKDSKRSGIKIVLTIVLVAIVGYMAYNWASSNKYFVHRMEQTVEGNSSDRDIIYERAWNLWYETADVVNKVFGAGYDGVFRRLKIAAHNDWLEILVDYGLVGVLLYLIVYIRFVRQIRFTMEQEIKVVMISAIAILFVKSLYSMSFNTSTLPLLMISFGTALGQYKSSNFS